MNYAKTAFFLTALILLFGVIGYLIGGEAGMLIALGIALCMNFFAYWNSDTIVLKMYKAEPVKADGHTLDVMLAKLSKRANVPKPKLYIIQSDQPNAFATGRNPDNSAVAITTGLWEMLSEEEVEGVIAHELAHITNYDTSIMTVVATISAAIGLLANFGFFFQGGRDRGNFFVVLLISILAPVAAMLIQMSISRTREYQADKLGAELTRKPLALASALKKIENMALQRHNPVADKNPATAHMFIMNPLSRKKTSDALFSTHPNTRNRIKALEELHDQMQSEFIS